MSYPLPRYTPSGRFNPLTLALFLGGIAAGAVVAWPYQLLLRVIPIIQLNFLLVAGFGAALAAAGYYAVRTGHCRNRVVALGLALVLAGVPLAASYYWEAKHVEDQIGFPTSVSDALAIKRHAGWQIGHGSGSPLKDEAVYFVWGGEALIVLGIVLFGVGSSVASPYCEKCRRWCEPKQFYVAGVGRAQAEPLLAKGELVALALIEPLAQADRSTSLSFTITECPGCHEAVFLTVEEKIVTVKKNKTSEKKKTLIKDVVLAAGQREPALERVNALVGQKLSA